MNIWKLKRHQNVIPDSYISVVLLKSFNYFVLNTPVPTLKFSNETSVFIRVICVPLIIHANSRQFVLKKNRPANIFPIFLWNDFRPFSR